MAWALDLDGVIWRGTEPIPGAAAAVQRLRAEGAALAFVTNNSYGRRADVAAKLASHGIEAGDDIISSAMAAATQVQPGERALICGGPGIAEALAERGVEAIDAGEPAAADAVVDVVVVGFHRSFDYQRMTTAMAAVRRGARLLGTNDDATYPTATGEIPGSGAILASVVTASGVVPVLAGKPHQPIADLVRDRLGDDGLMVGDRPDTDGLFAVALGWRFGLVLSGVTHADDLPCEPVPDRVTPDLAAMVEAELAGLDSGVGGSVAP